MKTRVKYKTAEQTVTEDPQWLKEAKAKLEKRRLKGLEERRAKENEKARLLELMHEKQQKGFVFWASFNLIKPMFWVTLVGGLLGILFPIFWLIVFVLDALLLGWMVLWWVLSVSDFFLREIRGRQKFGKDWTLKGDQLRQMLRNFDEKQ